MQQKVEFTKQEQNWLHENEEIAEEIEWVLDDAANVNPSNDGSFDKTLMYQAMACVKLVIELSNQNLLLGPYDELLYKKISDVFPELVTLKVSSEYFWYVFTSFCLDTKEEGNIDSNEAIFANALRLSFEELFDEDRNIDDYSEYKVDSSKIFSCESNYLEGFTGKGLHVKVI
jgi:hypothetical protein